MTKRLEVLQAVKALITQALPGVEVEGFDGSEADPDRIPANGRVLIEAGDPGKPEIDLCPTTYNYQHQIPVTIDALPIGEMTAEQAIDAMLDLLSTAIEADRFLGGLVDYLDAAAPPSNDDYIAGAPTSSSASVVIVATYSTTRPL